MGIGEWNAFLKRLSGQELGQVLTTMGFALIFQDLALIIWGGDPYTIPIPAVLSGAFQLGVLYFPVYRIFIIAVAAAVGLILWLVLERTRVGAMMRATVDDPEMARGVGINVHGISMIVFALGAFLAAVAGVEEAGGQVVQTLWSPLGTSDFGPYLAQLKRDVDAVYVVFSGADDRNYPPCKYC